MSTYTYNHQEQKASGVQFPAMLVLKNKQKYKMISAEDIAWDVKLNKGTSKETTINDTNDLLDYISGVEYNVDNILTEALRRPTYRIECEVTVCYSGDTFDKSPIIHVYKTLGEQTEELTYNLVIGEDIRIETSCTKPDADCLITYNETGQYLNGIAESGQHILKLLKDENNVIATLTISVLNKPEFAYSTVIYTESDDVPDNPSGGSYDAATNTFTPPTGWTEDYLSLNHNNKIWFSMGTVFSNSGSSTWSSPCLYVTEEVFVDNNKYLSVSVSVFKAVSTKQIEGDLVVDITEDITPITPSGGTYTFDTGELIPPEGWNDTLESAAQKYIENALNELKSFYKIYVSYNTYVFKYDGSVYTLLDSIGWTTPIEYINISNILQHAQENSKLIVNESVAAVTTDINASIQDFHDTLIGENGIINDITEQINNILSTVGDFVQVNSIIDSLKALYNWQKVDQLPEGLSATIIYDIFTEGDLKESEKYNSSEWYNKYVKLGNDGDYYVYTATSAELTTKLSKIENVIGENGSEFTTLLTAVNNMTPEHIRLLASKANLSDVTWTMVEKTEYNLVNADKKISVTTLPTKRYSSSNTTGYRFGYYYKLGNKDPYTYYRCDYPISTGFLDILSEKVSLGVSDDGVGANITFLITPEGSQTAINAQTITLTGKTLAAAIAAESLNIGNVTSLNKDGEVLFGQGKPGASAFHTDGTGSIGGGKIRWDEDGLTVNGKIIAQSGNIGGLSIYNDCLHARYENSIYRSELYVRPDSIRCDRGDIIEGIIPDTGESVMLVGMLTPRWNLTSDGSAMFANNNVMFNHDGSFKIGITKDFDENGNEVVLNSSGTGGILAPIAYSKFCGLSLDSNGNLSLIGVDVTITSDNLTQIGTQLSENDRFKGLITTNIGSKILGNLNTDDVSIGNGSCFFKGTNAENTIEGYPANTAGSGYLANKKITWDKDGDLQVTGKIQATQLTVMDPNTHTDAITFEVVPEGGFVGPDGLDIGLPPNCPVMVVRFNGKTYVTNLLLIGSNESFAGATARHFVFYDNVDFNKDAANRLTGWNFSKKSDLILWEDAKGILYSSFNSKTGIDYSSVYNGYVYEVVEKDSKSNYTNTSYANGVFTSMNESYHTCVLYAYKYNNGTRTEHNSTTEFENTESATTMKWHNLENGNFVINNVYSGWLTGPVIKRESIWLRNDVVELTIDNDTEYASKYSFSKIENSFKSLCSEYCDEDVSIGEFCRRLWKYNNLGSDYNEPNSKLKSIFNRIYNDAYSMASTGGYEEEEMDGRRLVEIFSGNSYVWGSFSETTQTQLNKISITYRCGTRTLRYDLDYMEDVQTYNWNS